MTRISVCVMGGGGKERLLMSDAWAPLHYACPDGGPVTVSALLAEGTAHQTAAL